MFYLLSRRKENPWPLFWLSRLSTGVSLVLKKWGENLTLSFLTLLISSILAELLVDKAMELKAVGGTFGGNVKPTPFICLVLKMLQIQPEKDIVVEFIRNEDYKLVFLFFYL